MILVCFEGIRLVKDSSVTRLVRRSYKLSIRRRIAESRFWGAKRVDFLKILSRNCVLDISVALAKTPTIIYFCEKYFYATEVLPGQTPEQARGGPNKAGMVLQRGPVSDDDGIQRPAEGLG